MLREANCSRKGMTLEVYDGNSRYVIIPQRQLGSGDIVSQIWSLPFPGPYNPARKNEQACFLHLLFPLTETWKRSERPLSVGEIIQRKELTSLSHRPLTLIQIIHGHLDTTFLVWTSRGPERLTGKGNKQAPFFCPCSPPALLSLPLTPPHFLLPHSASSAFCPIQTSPINEVTGAVWVRYVSIPTLSPSSGWQWQSWEQNGFCMLSAPNFSVLSSSQMVEEQVGGVESTSGPDTTNHFAGSGRRSS